MQLAVLLPHRYEHTNLPLHSCAVAKKRREERREKAERKGKCKSEGTIKRAEERNGEGRDGGWARQVARGILGGSGKRKTDNKGKSERALRMRNHSPGSTEATVRCLCDAGDSHIIS